MSKNEKLITDENTPLLHLLMLTLNALVLTAVTFAIWSIYSLFGQSAAISKITAGGFLP